MELSSKFLQSLLIVIISVHTVESVSCYECNSGKAYEGLKCESSSRTDLESFLIDCSTCRNTKNQLLPYAHCRPTQEFTHCRKTVQTVGSETRTIRSCATNTTQGNEAKCIERTGTKDVRVKYCECHGDRCNGSSGFIASILLIFGLVLGNAFANASFYYFRRTVV